MKKLNAQDALHAYLLSNDSLHTISSAKIISFCEHALSYPMGIFWTDRQVALHFLHKNTPYLFLYQSHNLPQAAGILQDYVESNNSPMYVNTDR